MSLSHDSIRTCHNGVTNGQIYDTSEKKNDNNRLSDREACNEIDNNYYYCEEFSKDNRDDVAERYYGENKTIEVDNGTKIENLVENFNIATKDIKFCNNIKGFEERIGKREISNDSFKKTNKNKNDENRYVVNAVNKQKDIKNNEHEHFKKQKIETDNIQNNLTNRSPVLNAVKGCVKNEAWQILECPLRVKKCASKALKRINEKYKRRSRWRIHSGVLISLVMLNVAGLSSAGNTSTFSSGLTTRMIASFLGYPSTCSLGPEVRPCTLTLSCWLRGGTRLRGCGGWLFSCCGLPETGNTFDNSIPSSEWKYKPPLKLRQVPQRSVVPTNVFRRRVDDDVTQMECGLPSSRILQKRIIGGREARFAEFPWQAHVRISEFQCGGVLVSRRFVATAAHCVSRAHTRDIAVWLGAIDTSATHHPARKLGVIQKILHPLFQFRMTQPDRYDVALLKLSRQVTYMTHILPICLPDHDMDLRGRSGVIAGWGKTDASNGHTGTNLLRSATVPILSKEQCINWHQSKQISVEIHSEMICAGHSDGHQDACLGDSGGPLIVLDSGRYYLVGITSAGFGCGVDHQPGIYHNVRLTANWIRSVITPTVNYNDNYLN